MDPRSSQTRRAGALFALLSALIASTLLLVAPTGSAGAPVRPPGTTLADTTYDDGFLYFRTEPESTCAGQPVALRVSACGCNVTFQSFNYGLDGAPTVRAVIRPDIMCAVCNPQAMSLPLGTFAAGHYTVLLHRVLVFLHEDGSVDSTSTSDFFTFDVSRDCLPPTGIQFLDGVLPGHPGPCPTCPPEACPNDSIPLYLFGQFPDPCLRLKEVRLLPPIETSLLPVPPLVEVVYARNSCVDVACPTVVTPWQARVFLPPLPPMPALPYQLHVRGVLEDDCAALPPLPMGNGTFAFVVVESCSTSTNGCFNASFAHNGSACDATFGNGKPAEATLMIQTPVPMAGLQGELALSSPLLEITNIETAGAAEGMVLSWTRQGNGARFVLYAEHGAPIFDPHRYFPPNPVPVLLVTVEPNVLADGNPPESVLLTGHELFGSDEQGRAVFQCPQLALIIPLEPVARLCRTAPCDHNADGRADVRDLVLLVRCVQNEGPCPEPITEMDCVHDGHLDLDDVMCCANVVLGLPAPDSLGGRPEPGVTVSLDGPVKLDDGTLEVAVRMLGTDFVGASRLELNYPWLRYDVVDVVKPSNARWLPVSQLEAGRVLLGLIAIRPKITLEIGEETWVVRLRLRDGQTPGGALSLSSATFSGPDGVGLITGFHPQTVPLGASAGLELAIPRPNPFAGVTETTIQLDDPADLEVGVFDLAGRRVASLFKGIAPSGVNVYRWNGMTDSGERAHSGVYFIRARSEGQVSSRKVLFVSANMRYAQ